MKKLVSALCMMLVGLTPALSQQTQQPKPTPTSESAEDVIRVNTSLVQTSITVFDKKGNFVEGLGPADFELRIDGEPTPISFLSRVAAGTAQERSQFEALRRGASPGPNVANNSELVGRTIIFFIDDLHLSPKSVLKTRQTITSFVQNQMAPNDFVAIASASGQIGFLFDVYLQRNSQCNVESRTRCYRAGRGL